MHKSLINLRNLHLKRSYTANPKNHFKRKTFSNKPSTAAKKRASFDQDTTYLGMIKRPVTR